MSSRRFVATRVTGREFGGESAPLSTSHPQRKRPAQWASGSSTRRRPVGSAPRPMNPEPGEDLMASIRLPDGSSSLATWHERPGRNWLQRSPMSAAMQLAASGTWRNVRQGMRNGVPNSARTPIPYDGGSRKSCGRAIRHAALATIHRTVDQRRGRRRAPVSRGLAIPDLDRDGDAEVVCGAGEHYHEGVVAEGQDVEDRGLRRRTGVKIAYNTLDSETAGFTE